MRNGEKQAYQNRRFFNPNTTASEPGNSANAGFITEAIEQEIFLLVSPD